MGFITAGETVEMTCAECGSDFNQDIASTRCESENLNFCGQDCANKHQERTGHPLIHLTS